MQRRFLRLQFGDERRDPVDRKLVGHRGPLLFCSARSFRRAGRIHRTSKKFHPRWQPTRLPADMTANPRIGSPYTSPSTRQSPLADDVPSRYFQFRTPRAGAEHEAISGDSAEDFWRTAIRPRSTIGTGVACRSAVGGCGRCCLLNSCFGSIGRAHRRCRIRRLAQRRARCAPPDQTGRLAKARRDAVVRQHVACRRPARGRVAEGTDGFKIALFADGLSGPRQMRVAPNGDIFVAETGAGRIRVLRAADGGESQQQRDLRQRTERSLRHRFFSSERSEMGLCRQHRQRRAVSLSSGDLKASLPETVSPNCRMVAAIRPATSPSA